MTPVPLDTFFALMADMLDGRRSAREVEQTLGPSPSGTTRLGLYVALVERQQRTVLDEFYAAARAACESVRPGRFAKLRDAYLRKHPPSHWAPARAAEHFGAFLQAQPAPAEVVELADFAWTRHLVLHAPHADDASGLAVRHYTYAVRDFSLQVERSGTRSGRPAKKPETWLIGRSRESAELVILEPSVAALVAVQVLEDRGWSAELPSVPRQLVVNEAHQLRLLGLISHAALSSLTGWLR